MSRGFPDAVRPEWVRWTGHWQEFLVISEIESWVSHWDARIGKSRRCGGPGCALCHMGYQKQLRVVVMTIDKSGRDTLIELRERHRTYLDGVESVVGLKVRMKKMGAARNSRIELDIIGSQEVATRDIKRLVLCLGEEPLFAAGGEARFDPIQGIIDEIARDAEAVDGPVVNPEGYEDFE